MIAKPTHPMRPVAMLDGQELRCLKGPIIRRRF